MSETHKRESVLTIGDLVELAQIARWAQTNTRVCYLVPDGGGRTNEGIVRSIGTADGMGFLRNDEDVRDGFVRITTSMGFEWFPSVPDVAQMIRRGEMAPA